MLESIWNYVLPIGQGITIGGIILMVLIPLMKGVLTRKTSAIDSALKTVVKKVEENNEKMLSQIQGVSFKQSIQPLVESGLEKINEKSQEYIDKRIVGVEKRQDAIYLMFTRLASYFDDSSVSEEKKTALHEAIEQAEATFNKVEEEVEAVVEIAQSPKTPQAKSKVIR